MKALTKVMALFLTLSVLAGCGVQSIPQSKNQVEAALAEVTNQYKRRADLVPNLVNVVKGYAKHEEQTLTAVVEARAKATQVTVDPSKITPEKLREFQAAQTGMSQALGRLMVVSEQYPNLKADTQFRDLQAQLEGTENRITIARQRYIQAVQEFNNYITVPPTSWTNSLLYHNEKMPQWDVGADEKGKVEKPPQVNF
ncbi:MAG: LemA family protein [Pseudobdellovibrionaceae bacterium]